MKRYMLYISGAALFAASIAAMQLAAMQAPATPTALKDFPFNGASVLPFTQWPSKPEKYALLMREAFGNDKGTYDACGGARNPKEQHPIVTAGREFAEETIELVGKKSKIKKHIDVDAPYTLAVVANYNKKFVIYLTEFDHTALEYLAKHFYAARANTTNGKHKEKDSLAWVKWSNLSNAIANAQRDQNGHLYPVTVWANVVDANGSKRAEQITLRSCFVSTMQSYFRNDPYTEGKSKKIRFYQR